MKFSISNIAWDVELDDSVITILKSRKFEMVDISPTTYYGSWSEITERRAKKLFDKWQSNGFEIYGMQSLFFGLPHLNIFGSRELEDASLSHMEHVCRIANILGVKRLVFGSPKNRLKNHLSNSEAFSNGIRFFRKLGHIASIENVVICLEANPERYGGDFILDTDSAAELVRECGHSHIRLQWDIGASIMNGESISRIVDNYSKYIAFVHISEPDLCPVPQNKTVHKMIYSEISNELKELIFSIEMIKVKDASNQLENIRRAIDFVLEAYGD